VTKPILVLDLDGTLIRNDLTFELFVLCARWHPLLLLYACIIALSDRARAKSILAKKLEHLIDVEHLPYTPEVLELMNDHKRAGHKVALVSGSDELLVGKIAEHLKIDAYKGSTPGTNLVSKRKANYLTETYGSEFIYAGNSKQDFAVWRAGQGGFGVNAPSGSYNLRDADGREVSVEKLVERQSEWRALGRGLRMHQWAKNLLILIVPAIQIINLNPQAFIALFWAFLAFSILASATYLLNDLFDMQDDRLHRTKRKRPLANGDLSVPLAIWFMLLAIPSALYMAFAINTEFGWTTFAYLCVTIIYSFRLKRIAVADVFTLSGLFSIRVIAGAYVVGFPPSGWLLTFIGAFFLSLAIGKRFIEVRALSDRDYVPGRGYVAMDAIPLLASGAATGTIAVLAMLIYGLSAPTTVFNSEAVVLFGSALLLSWVFRFWLMAGRGNITDDPVEFAIKNRQSLTLLSLISFLFAADLTSPLWLNLF